MSGNAALASARRRRAGPSNAPPPQPKQTQKTSTKSSTLNKHPQKRINPLNLVVQHNTMINEMKEDMMMMKREMELFKNVNTRISKIEEQLDSDLNLNNISFFKKSMIQLKNSWKKLNALLLRFKHSH